MPAITTIPAFYPTQFETNWMTLAQQKESRLTPTVTMQQVQGKEKRMNQLGSRTMQQITGRAQATRISDQITAARWLSPYPFDDASLFDRWDEEFLGEIVLPQSNIIAQMVAGYNRSIDQTIINAAVGSARTGADGLTLVPLPSSQQVAVDFVEQGSAANSGLTIAKLRQAKYEMDVADVDDEDRTLVLSAKQVQDLLRTTEVTHADYNTVRALVTGQVDTYMGFKFKRVSAALLPYVSATDVRACVAYAKSGIALTDTGVKASMAVRHDLSDALQVRVEAAYGATRLEEVKVVEIFCDESP